MIQPSSNPEKPESEGNVFDPFTPVDESILQSTSKTTTEPANSPMDQQNKNKALKSMLLRVQNQRNSYLSSSSNSAPTGQVAQKASTNITAQSTQTSNLSANSNDKINGFAGANKYLFNNHQNCPKMAPAVNNGDNKLLSRAGSKSNFGGFTSTQSNFAPKLSFKSLDTPIPSQPVTRKYPMPPPPKMPPAKNSPSYLNSINQAIRPNEIGYIMPQENENASKISQNLKRQPRFAIPPPPPPPASSFQNRAYNKMDNYNNHLENASGYQVPVNNALNLNRSQDYRIRSLNSTFEGSNLPEMQNNFLSPDPSQRIRTINLQNESKYSVNPAAAYPSSSYPTPSYGNPISKDTVLGYNRRQIQQQPIAHQPIPQQSIAQQPIPQQPIPQQSIAQQPIPQQNLLSPLAPRNSLLRLQQQQMEEEFESPMLESEAELNPQERNSQIIDYLQYIEQYEPVKKEVLKILTDGKPHTSFQLIRHLKKIRYMGTVAFGMIMYNLEQTFGQDLVQRLQDNGTDSYVLAPRLKDLCAIALGFDQDSESDDTCNST